MNSLWTGLFIALFLIACGLLVTERSEVRTLRATFDSLEVKNQQLHKEAQALQARLLETDHVLDVQLRETQDALNQLDKRRKKADTELDSLKSTVTRTDSLRRSILTEYLAALATQAGNNP